MNYHQIELHSGFDPKELTMRVNKRLKNLVDEGGVNIVSVTQSTSAEESLITVMIVYSGDFTISRSDL